MTTISDSEREKNPARVRAGQARQRQLREALGDQGYRARQKELAQVANSVQLATLGPEAYRQQRRDAYQALVDKIGARAARERVRLATEARRRWRLDNPTHGELVLRLALDTLRFNVIRSCDPFDYAAWRETGEYVHPICERTAIIEGYVDNYICDVLVPIRKLAIEVYGGVHALQQVRDACRKQALQAHGLRVLVLRDDASTNEMRRAIVSSLWEP